MNGQPMNVIVRDGKPAMIRIKRQSLRVKEVLDVRPADAGWRRSGAAGLYFLLEFDGGMRLTVFHDPERNGWYRPA
jgi:hypothetical protein